LRHDYDPFYQEIYVKNRITPEMRFLEKTAIMAEIEQEIDAIRDKAPKMNSSEIREKYGVHPILNCPDIDAADAMVEACNKISDGGDSAGGVVEVVVTGLPAGLGEPVFCKLDGDLRCSANLMAIWVKCLALVLSRVLKLVPVFQ
jgi:chorismate synthase